MKKNLLYILISLCAVFASCDDYLDVAPQTQVPAEDFFSQETGYEDALTGCYIKMNSSNLYGMFLSFSGIDYMASYYDKMTATSDEYAFRTFNYKNSTVESQFKNTYNELYNIILQANDVIVNIDSQKGKDAVKSELKRNIIKGEALAIRAFCHFDLLRIFGQLPQNATITVSLPYSETTGVEDRPLYPYDQFVEKLEKDLTESLTLLKDDPATLYSLVMLSLPSAEMFEATPYLEDDFYLYRKFRFNYWAVKALMARFYLYVGDTANAYTTAMEVINAKASDGNNIVSFASEHDFSKGNFTLPTETLMALSNSNLENMTTTFNDLFKSEQVTDPMRFTDERKNELFLGRNTGNNNRYNRLWGKYTTITGVPQPYLRKYFQNEVSVADEDKLVGRWQTPILRLSEMYLIAMECTDNLTELNSLFYTYMVDRNEQPADFTTLEAAKDEIFNELRREFIAEGQMFFAYKRMGAENMVWSVADVKEENYIVPVPSSEKR